MIDVAKMQTRLAAAGYPVGAADGIPGRKTLAGAAAYVSGKPMPADLSLGEALAKWLPQYGILDNDARFANFMGQASHESGGFRYMREIWGPTDIQKRYEGRADLGNTQPGDGKRYMGRGIFQITGRANYRAMGQAIGVDLETSPELAEQPDNAVHTACAYWQSRKLSVLADAVQDDTITRRINGGTNGIDDRRARVARMKGLLA